MNIKSFACLTAALAVGTALADIEIQLGITKVVSPNKNTIVAVPYKGFTPGANITVADVVKTANLLPGDKCYVMNTESGFYDAWVLTSGAGGVLAWEPTTQVRLDKNGDPSATTATTAAEKTLAPGSALWIVREGTVRDYSVPFYLWGSYEGSVPPSTVTASADGTWNLIANTGDTAVSVQDLFGMLTTWVYGDRIVVPSNGFSRDFSKKNATGKWMNSDLAATTKIDPGMGCWVFKKGTGGNITWPNVTAAE